MDRSAPLPKNPLDPLLSCLRKWLPKAPCPILLVGSRTSFYAEQLSAAGYDLTCSRDVPATEGRGTESERQEAESPVPPFAGIVLLEVLAEGTELPHLLETLRNLLTESGVLILAGVLELPTLGEPPGSALLTAHLDAALAEAGFCVRRQKDIDASDFADDLESRERLVRLRQGRAVYWIVGARRDPYRIRPYREGDEDQILELFREAFHHDRGPAHWSWQYRSNPQGSVKLSLAFDEQGQLVAQYAAYPVAFLRLEDGKLETLPCHQVGDTMTRPSVRGIGRGPTSLLGRTARHFFARFCEGQVFFNYGFNVGNIQRFSMLILKAKRVAPVTFWSRSVGPPKLRNPSPWRRWLGARVEEVQTLDERWDRFLRGVAPEYGFLVSRDRAYLKWRYLERPGFRYHIFAGFDRGRLMAWGVFRREGHRLIWGDGLLDSQAPRWAEYLLAEALASPFAQGVSQIDGWFAPQPAFFRRELLRLGFKAEPEPQDLALMLSPFESEPSAKTLKTELFYTLGDSDLF